MKNNSKKDTKTQQKKKQPPNDVSLQLAPLNIDLANVGKPKRARKFTVQRRRIFFTELMRDFNITRAAHAAGVNRDIVAMTKQRDAAFRAKFEEIEMAVLDQAASVNVILSQTASREGFPDRKLLLTTRHPLYKQDSNQVNVNVQVNNVQAASDLHHVIDMIPEPIDYVDVDFSQVQAIPQDTSKSPSSVK